MFWRVSGLTTKPNRSGIMSLHIEHLKSMRSTLFRWSSLFMTCESRLNCDLLCWIGYKIIEVLVCFGILEIKSSVVGFVSFSITMQNANCFLEPHSGRAINVIFSYIISAELIRSTSKWGYGFWVLFLSKNEFSSSGSDWNIFRTYICFSFSVYRGIRWGHLNVMLLNISL